MAVELHTVEIPATVTVRKENPYQGVLDHLVKNEGKAASFSLPAKTDTDRKAVESAIGHIQRGARALGFSARKQVVTEKDVATLTVWLVDAIKRDRSKSE